MFNNFYSMGYYYMYLISKNSYNCQLFEIALIIKKKNVLQHKSGVSGIPPPPVPKDDPKKPPILPNKNKNPEPDYEVIEFGQYSNAPPVSPKVGNSKYIKRDIKFMEFYPNLIN